MISARKIKKIVKKVPFIAGTSKLVYDWKNEKRLQKRIKNFLKNKNLPFTDKAPESYELGYEPTIRCNLKCKMCYQGQTRALRREELNTAETLNIFDKLKDKVKSLKLIGGEPLVRDDIFELISYWDKAGKKIILHSNLTLLDEKNADKLKQFKNVTDVLTSLDGQQRVHDAIRGVPGAFERMKRAVELVKEKMPRVPITVFATLLITENLNKLTDLIDTAKSMGIETVNILFEQVYSPEDINKTKEIFKKVFGWNEGGYRLNTQVRDFAFPDGLDPAKLKRQLFKIRMYGIKKGCFINFVPFNYYHKLDKYLGLKKTKTFCLKLLSPELRINQTGDVVWCDVIEKSFGNLLEKAPDEIWLSEDYQKFRKHLFEKGLPICYRCCKASYVK